MPAQLSPRGGVIRTSNRDGQEQKADEPAQGQVQQERRAASEFAEPGEVAADACDEADDQSDVVALLEKQHGPIGHQQVVIEVKQVAIEANIVALRVNEDACAAADQWARTMAAWAAQPIAPPTAANTGSHRLLPK